MASVGVPTRYTEPVAKSCLFGGRFKVREDKVLVRDFSRGRRILLRAGQSYLAAAR